MADTLTARMAPPGVNLYANMRGRRCWLAWGGFNEKHGMPPPGTSGVLHVCKDATEKALQTFCPRGT